jgi:tetratricopeptide (TPR) repeat protein
LRHPRACQGDALEAIAAYRAALTMDTSVGGEPLPADARKRTQERLEALAKKAGLGDSWSSVNRKAADVTPALIEQLLRAKRVGDAVLAWKKSDEYKTKTKAAFHVDVGRAFKQVPDLRDQAVEAFAHAIACDGGSAAACHEMGDLEYDAHEYDAAKGWYLQALALEPRHALARSGVANCEKDKGNLEAAVENYKKAVDTSPQDPTFVFNLAQVNGIV